MNRLAAIVWTAFLCLVALVAAAVFWPFVIAGSFALALSGMKYNRWMSSSAALGLVLIWRGVTGCWIIRIGDVASVNWYFEGLVGTLNLVFALILVPCFAQWPARFLEGYKSTLGITRDCDTRH